MAAIIGWSMASRIMVATAVAGTLDILAAIGLTLFFGGKVPAMLRYVASGPIPPARDMGATGAALGPLVHFALMAVMASAYILTADRVPMLRARPLPWGVVYGVITWAAMNLIAIPARFGTWPASSVAVATQLFCHIVLVGIPITLIARR